MSSVYSERPPRPFDPRFAGARPQPVRSESDRCDPDSSPDDPRWYGVEVKLDKIFKRFVPLDELRTLPALEKMVLLKRGSRLSVQPVTPEEWKVIVALGNG